MVHHVYQAAGSPPSLDTVIRIRDFGFPIIIMTAYVAIVMAMTRASAAGPFLRRRLQRLGVPFVAWTLIYCAVHALLAPWLHSDRWFSPAVLVTGYVHLWFLSFLLMGTVVAVPFVRLALARDALVSSGVVACAVGVWYLAFVGPSLNQLVWTTYGDAFGPDMRIFLTQSTANFGYVPLGCGVGLLLLSAERPGAWRPHIPTWLPWLLFVAAFAIHMHAGTFISRLGFSLTLFLALLRAPEVFITHPWTQAIAGESYAIYLLHFGGARLMPRLLTKLGLPVDGATVVASAVVIFLGALALARALRRWGRVDWLLPPATSRRTA